MRATPGRRSTALLLAAVLGLQACIVVPRTTTRYDPDCQLVSRHVELEVTQIAALGICHSGPECSAVLATAGVVTAASAVISGSIAIVGNVAYWLERQGQCLRAAPP